MYQPSCVVGRCRLVLFCVAALLLTSSAYAEKWVGWRGGDRHAVSETPVAEEWSRNENLAWKTVIRGRGNSSPIVWDNTIYVPTVYETDAWRHAHQRMGWIEATLALLAGGLAIGIAARYARRLTWRSENRTAILLAFGAIAAAAVLILFTVLGESMLDYKRSPMRAWIGTSVLAAACLMLSAFLAPPRSWARYTMAALAIAFAIAVPLGVPDKTHSWRFEILRPNLGIVLATGALSLIPALLLIRRRNGLEPEIPVPAENATASATLRNTLIIVLGVVATIAAAILLIRAGRGVSDYINYHFPNARINPLLGWKSLAILGIAALVVMPLLAIAYLRLAEKPLVRVVAIVPVLALAALHFTRNNYLPHKQETVRAIYALDRETGATKWYVEALAGPPDHVHRDNSPASPTPTADENGIYAYFGTSGLIGVSHDGQLMWEMRDLPYESPYGAASSPVVYNGTLVLCADQPKKPYMISVDVKTGKLLWRKDLPEPHDYWGGNSRTPIVRNLNGRDTLLVWHWVGLKGYDLKTSEELWHYKIRTRGEVVPSFTFDDKYLYMADARFARKVEIAELGKSAELPVLWETQIPGPDASSPVVAKGLMYTASMVGVVSCIDTETGDLLWRKRLGGRYYSSPIVAGDRVYLTDFDGMTVVLELSREFKLVSENELEATTFASVAPVEGRLLIRTAEELYCIERPGNTPNTVARAQ